MDSITDSRFQRLSMHREWTSVERTGVSNSDLPSLRHMLVSEVSVRRTTLSKPFEVHYCTLHETADDISSDRWSYRFTYRQCNA